MSGSDFKIKHAETDEDFRRVFPVVQVLCPHIASADDLIGRARRQRAQSGWRLKGEPVAIASFRISEWLVLPRAWTFPS